MFYLVVVINSCQALIKIPSSIFWIFWLELDRISWVLGHQVLNPVLQAPSYTHQFQMLTPECQQALLAQVLSCTPGNQTDTFPGSPANFASPNVMLPKIELSANDEQVSGNNDLQVLAVWFPYVSKKLELWYELLCPSILCESATRNVTTTQPFYYYLLCWHLMCFAFFNVIISNSSYL